MSEQLRGIGLCFVLLAVGGSTASAQGPLNGDGHLIDFSRDVAPILVEHCLECHGPKEAKNDFRVDDRESLLGYVTPSDPSSSTLWTDCLVSTDADTLMPPASKGGPLSVGELALIRLWIEEGANWPEGALVVAGAVPVAIPTPAAETVPAASFPARLWAFQGYFHPATVHFPIALISISAFFIIIAWIRPQFGDDVAFYCLFVGAISAVLAAAMGWSFAAEQGYGSWTRTDNGNLARHRWFGIAVSLLSIGLTIWAYRSRRRVPEQRKAFWKIGVLVLAALVGIVGHQGGELTYEHLYDRALNRLQGTTEKEVTPAPENTPPPTA